MLTLKLNNLASILQKIFKVRSTFTYLPCRDYLRNRSRSKKRLLKDAQQSYVKHVARRSDPGLFGFTSQCLYCEKLCTDDKKHFDRKNFEIASILNTKIYTSALEISRDT